MGKLNFENIQYFSCIMTIKSLSRRQKQADNLYHGRMDKTEL